MKMLKTACLAASSSVVVVDACRRLAPLHIQWIVGIAGKLFAMYLIHGTLSEIPHVFRIVLCAVSLGIKSVVLVSWHSTM